MVKRVLYALVVILLCYIGLVTVAEFPPYGEEGNPVHNYVSERYIGEAVEDTGVINMVTAIVLDYRAYDTLIETTVLFTATIAVLITLKTGKKNGKEEEVS
ncbi:MAG: hypothetical protein M0Q40_05970 [Limnochordia bacterium]|nr:hypothetical protein [Limnochordia bacterium]